MPLLELCYNKTEITADREIEESQTEAQRQYSLHGTHSLQHSIPICIIAPLVFPDKLQSNNKW